MKKRILFITPQLPYPAVSGGVTKSNRMIDYLSKKYDLSLVFFIKNEDAKYVQHYLSSIKIVNKYYTALNVPRSALTFLKSLLFNIPMSVIRNKSQTMKKEVARISRDCDVIIVDHFLMFQYLPDNFRGRIIVHQHNAEFVLWSRYSEMQNNIIKKYLIQFEANRIKCYEKCMMSRADRVLAAPNDIEVLKPLLESNHNKFIETYHLGDESLLAEQDLVFEDTQKSLLYIGTLSWEANRDGLYWFLENVWPELKAKNPDLIFDIIGKLSEGALFLKWHNDPNIKWHGFVEDILPFYNVARVFVAPLRFGSGIKVKVVNALYRGLPTVTTSIGVEGLTVLNDEHICFNDKESKQVEMIETLLGNKDYWCKISKKSRDLAKEKYTWDYVLKNLSKAIEDD